MKRAVSNVATAALFAAAFLPFASASAGPLDQVGAARRMIGDVRQKVESKQEEIKTQVQGEFCGRFADVTARMAERMTEAENRVSDRIRNREGSVEDRRDTRDEELSAIRSRQDARRIEWYGKLVDRALSDEQKEAVEKFRKTVDQAVEDRRDAVDAAIAAFRSGVDSLVSGKKGVAEDAVEEFRKSVDAAVAQAKADCESGKDPETIRNSFRDSLKAARTRLAERRKAAEGIGSQVEALAKTQNEAVREAQETFRKTFEQALTDLRKVFPSADGTAVFE
ncbi:MAG: hypothetical protein HGB18_02570 [Candidatus Moranbacteria bacterium]|nr:hypothetical protein [Candidatus Moranbacteria bacterium]